MSFREADPIFDFRLAARAYRYCDISYVTIYLPIYRATKDTGMWNGIWIGCSPRGGRGGWDFDPDFIGWFGGGRRGRGGPFRSGRMFEQGDLKYVILQLLEEKPRHGYEIISALEARFGGVDAPSGGGGEPTLTPPG